MDLIDDLHESRVLCLSSPCKTGITSTHSVSKTQATTQRLGENKRYCGRIVSGGTQEAREGMGAKKRKTSEE